MSTSDEQKQRRHFLTRRDFFTRPFAWLARKTSSSEQGEAIPGRIPLSALKDIQEAVLMRMVPILRQNWTVYVCEAGIAYRDSAGQEGMVYLEPEDCAAALMFDGIRTLEQVAVALEAELGMTAGHGAFIVREAFLTLAMSEVYHPNEPLGTLLSPTLAKDQYA